MKLGLVLLWFAAPAFAQIPDAPKPQPFSIIATDTERYINPTSAKPAFTDNILAAGVSYQVWKSRIITSVTYGRSVQTGNSSINANVTVRIFQFGKKSP